jgi:hypothetical protein
MIKLAMFVKKLYLTGSPNFEYLNEKEPASNGKNPVS